MQARAKKPTFVAGGITALFGAVAACTSGYDTQETPDASVPPPLGISDAAMPAPDAGPSDAPAGGSCDGGKCAPANLAQGLARPGYIRLTGKDVIVLGESGVLRVSKAGGPTLVSLSSKSATGLAVAADGAVIVATQEGIRLLTPESKAPITIASKPTTEVAVFAGAVFGCSSDAATPSEVVRYTLSAGSTGTVMVKDANLCESIATDGATVYFGGDALNRVDAQTSGTSGSKTAFTQKPARRLVIDAEYVYSIASDSPSVLKTTRATAAVAVLAESPDATGAGDIALDATHVYWTTGKAGGVYRVPKAGGPVEPIALAQDFPTGIAVDDEAVYWTEREGGTLRKLPK